MCVCVLHACECTNIHFLELSYIVTRRLEADTGHLPLLLSDLLYWERVSHDNQKFTILAKLAVQWAPETCLLATSSAGVIGLCGYAQCFFKRGCWGGSEHRSSCLLYKYLLTHEVSAQFSRPESSLEIVITCWCSDCSWSQSLTAVGWRDVLWKYKDLSSGSQHACK